MTCWRCLWQCLGCCRIEASDVDGVGIEQLTAVVRTCATFLISRRESSLNALGMEVAALVCENADYNISAVSRAAFFHTNAAGGVWGISDAVKLNDSRVRKYAS